MVMAFVAIVVLLALLKVPTWVITLTTTVFVSAFTGAILTFVSTAFVEALTGDFLKPYLLKIPIGDYEFSVSLFLMATLIVKVWLFGL